MADLPLMWQWNGETLIPHGAKAAAEADKQLVVGEIYKIAVVENITAESRGHYMATLKEIWKNLPQDQADRFPTPVAMRKHALIHEGFFNVREFVAANKREATALALFVRPDNDEYAVITVKECTVQIITAKSQSDRAMGNKEFQKSKWAVLNYCSAMIGVTPQQATKNSGRRA